MTLKVSLFLSTVLICGVAFAQQPASTPTPTAPEEQPANGNQKLPTVHVRTDEVNVVFTVVDKSGNLCRSFDTYQFRLLIDASNSIRDRFQFEKDSISEFLYEIIRPKTDKAFVLPFDEKYAL